MGPLPPQTESVEQLIVDALYDLTDAGYAAPEQLGTYFTAGVALGRADEPRPVVIEPPSVILRPFEALVGHIRAREEGRAHTRKPWVWPGSYGEEGFRHLLVGGGGGCETEARDHPRGIDGGEQAEALVPSQAVGPPDVSVADQSHPSPRRFASRTGIAELSR